jgi:hypothetical protein
MMDRYEVWGAILIVAALVALAIQYHHWRRGRLSTLQMLAGGVARLAFLFLGIVYATSLIDRWPKLPLAGLFVAGIGIFLNMAVNVFTLLRRSHAEDSTP